jgi:hypothetical protein
MPLWSGPVTFIKSLEKKILELLQNLPQKQARFIIICCGAAALILFITILLWAADHNRNTAPDAGQELSDSLGPRSIPAEELFLPGEPDFLPEVLLDPEPAPWTAEDARPFWTDPREGGSELWQERIKTVIDDLLENIP